MRMTNCPTRSRPPIPLFQQLRHWRRWRQLQEYIAYAKEVPGWTRDEEATALAWLSLVTPSPAVVVEVGSFLGASTVLLAAARKLRGTGIVHCIDAFDCSGDAYSVPYYKEIAGTGRGSVLDQFRENIRRASLSRWIEVHHGTAAAIAACWMQPIDLLFLDADQSPQGARAIYEQWAPFLRPGGLLAIHNSSDRQYEPEHDGNRRVVVESIRPPTYRDVYCVGTTTFARQSLSKSRIALSRPRID